MLVLVAAGTAAIAASASRSDLGGSSIASICWAKKTRAAYIYVIMTTVALAMALVLRTLSIFFFTVGSSINTVDVGSLGEVSSLNLITFTFFGMVGHYWSAGAYVSAVVLLFNSFIVAYAVIIMCAFLWWTPCFKRHRRLLVRIAMFLSRISLIDVVFFGYVAPVLRADISLPLAISVHLRTIVQAGVYAGIASTVFCIFTTHCLLWALPSAVDDTVNLTAENGRALSPPRWRLLAARLPAVAIFVGFALWGSAEFFSCSFGELGGDFLAPKSYSGKSLAVDTWQSDPILSTTLFVVVFMAPILQAMAVATMSLAEVRGAPKLFTASERVRQFGDAISVLDVFLIGSVAVILEVDAILKWIVNNKFSGLCAKLDYLTGSSCISASPQAEWGALGLLLAVVGSFALTVHSAVTDITKRKADAPTRDLAGPLQISPC